jgi:hypothetical protein
MSETFKDMFLNKYVEFCDDLLGTLPELKDEVTAAKNLSDAEKYSRFVAEVLPTASPTRQASECPGTILPGVSMTPKLWEEIGKSSQDAIQQYLTVLSFCSLYDIGSKSEDATGNAKAWSDSFLKDWQSKLSGIDFKNLSEKLNGLFGKAGEGFKIPEQFLKGHIAKLAEEIVSEFKPEDFGLDAETLAGFEKDPTRTMELLMNIYTNKPEVMQNAMKRIIKRLQEKFRKGELRPQQIAHEAEQLMKEFGENASFVELMETFRNTFGMHDPEVARSVGRDSDARRNIVRERLRKKLEKRKSGN